VHRRRFRDGARPVQPKRKLAIVSCMDSRLDLFDILGLDIGDAHVLRNAGGRVTDDVLRSLMLSEHRLGTREVGVIHHSDCGLHYASNAALRDLVRERTGHEPSRVDFLPFDDLDQSVRDDVDRLLLSPHLPTDLVVWGAVYEVEPHRLRVVVPPTSHEAATGPSSAEVTG
jgi:carbonic anhydrase